MGLFDLLEEIKDDIAMVAEDVATSVGYMVGDATRVVDEKTRGVREGAQRAIDLSNTLLVDEAVDLFRDKVTPVRGSVLYTDLAIGFVEHSGIYIGNNRIVELNSDGYIEIVTPKQFMQGGTGTVIYVSCDGKDPVGDEDVAEWAELQVGGCTATLEYNVIFDNCHQFTLQCINEDPCEQGTLLAQVKSASRDVLGTTTWRVWHL